MDEKLPLLSLQSIIDVGVTADQNMAFSNFFEKFYPYPERITAFSDQDASWMEDQHKGLRFARGDGRNMPFQDNAFDLVFSSAVVEHVGNRKNQKAFLSECIRVSKKFSFITTPNRWHPCEFHTVLPFLHWLPKNVYRRILTWIGKEFFSHEDNLNLLTSKDIVRMLNEINETVPFRFSIESVRFLGLPSNLLILIEKL